MAIPEQSARAFTLWLTGLSGAGKTTIAQGLSLELMNRNKRVHVIEGEEIRKGVSQGLGFSSSDKKENVRRGGEVAKIFLSADFITICAFISPHADVRSHIRSSHSPYPFVEVFVHCPLEVCQSRDTKGLYNKAAVGALTHLSGVDDVYEEPKNPDVIVHTHQQTADESVATIISYLERMKLI